MDRARLSRFLAPCQLPRTDWALTPGDLELVLELIDAGRDLVLECGSGISTVASARLLAARGAGRAYAIEHDTAWATRVAAAVAAEGGREHCRVIAAPLAPHPLARPGCHWYAEAALDQLPDRAVTLLLVDGPPAGERATQLSRYPALPALGGRLARDALVVLDDAERSGERQVIRAWERETPFRFRRRGERLAVGERR